MRMAPNTAVPTVPLNAWKKVTDELATPIWWRGAALGMAVESTVMVEPMPRPTTASGAARDHAVVDRSSVLISSSPIVASAVPISRKIL